MTAVAVMERPPDIATIDLIIDAARLHTFAAKD
jgi:hypothetical protein